MPLNGYSLMAKVCEICGKRSYSNRCVQHKPRKPITTKKPLQARSKPLQATIAKKTHKLSTKAKKPATKPVKRSKVVRDLDAIFSQYIRLKYANEYGEVECYTCGNKMNWKEAQNGHFYSRARYTTRWDEANCRVQDYRCNVALSGNYIVYTRNMLAEIGAETLDQIEHRSKSIEKIPTSLLIEKITYYKTEVARIKSKKSLQL